MWKMVVFAIVAVLGPCVKCWAQYEAGSPPAGYPNSIVLDLSGLGGAGINGVQTLSYYPDDASGDGWGYQFTASDGGVITLNAEGDVGPFQFAVNGEVPGYLSDGDQLDIGQANVFDWDGNSDDLGPSLGSQPLTYVDDGSFDSVEEPGVVIGVPDPAPGALAGVCGLVTLVLRPNRSIRSDESTV